MKDNRDNQDLRDLIKVLEENGYKKFATNEYEHGDLWQKKHSSGAFLNFNVYEKSDLLSTNMVTAEIYFECSDIGLWCQHSLYGISVGQMSLMVEDTEGKLLHIFKLYNGDKYACLQ